MSKIGYLTVVLAIAVLSVSTGVQAAILGFEAESGTLGANYTITADASALGGNYLASANQTGNSPDEAADLATYSVTLEAGTYDLYARIYVGGGTGDDDSIFIGNGFGAKAIDTGDDWIRVNNLQEDANSYQTPEGDEFVNETAYQWLKFSTQVTQDEAVPQFVSTGATETFIIGHREDGFRVDAFAFVSDGETPSSAQLSAAVPEPATLSLLAFGGLAALRRRRK